MITCAFENGGPAQLRHVVVHAIVEKDGALLLEKRAGNILETGKWSLPSGFLDRNETAAEGALRELHEETGWEGKIVSLFRINSRPDRPKEDRQNIAIEFIIDPIQKTGEPDHESSKVEWISFEKLLSFSEFAFDHGESIRLFLEYRRKKFPLPIIE
jgi:ADP-ribose pyrophosphatase YjhB (NUDIX family)